MPGRRWSDGLHQAISQGAVKIERENQTLATITFQNYFRITRSWHGMTGTAETEAAELKRPTNSSGGDPPNRPLCAGHQTWSTAPKTRNSGMRQEIKDFTTGPAGAGRTISVKMDGINALRKMGVQHEVLNAKIMSAKLHRRAGLALRPITVSTNMAGAHRHPAGRNRVSHQGTP